MPDPRIAPYGSWKSPISADMMAASFIGLDEIRIDGDDIYWLELRPSEGGRAVITQYTPDDTRRPLTPPDYYARTRVHEYGGGAYAVHEGTIYFSNFRDQRLYRQRPNAAPEPLTPEGYRYADGVIATQRNVMFCVREDHTGGGEPVNTLVRIYLAGGGPGEVIVSGADFYSSPRLSPDRMKLAWLTWNHPNMPWDGTELWIGELDEVGDVVRAQRIAGGLEESVSLPQWSPDGVLHFVSDRTTWWNLYRWRDGEIEALYPMEAEFATPQWVFGQSQYAFEAADRILCIINDCNKYMLARLNTTSGTLERIETPYSVMSKIRAGDGFAVFQAYSPTEPAAVVKLDFATGKMEVLRKGGEGLVDAAYLSVPETIEFPTEGGLTAHAFYYPPHNPDFIAPPGELPPLLTLSHGGPTAATLATLHYDIQYWTSRGFGVVDVNYGGSTGYGREYRQRLNGQWGIVDMDDCCNAAKYLVEQGKADPARLTIAGGSAGGYTTLCALTFRDTFSAGASHFGVSDLEALAKDTHKFESRYLDSMIGPYPERADLYHERSPIHYTHLLSRPMILLQGLDDPVVPPSQAEKMFEAVRAKEIPVAYVPFAGEQHGFRKAENIKRAAEAELYFYSRIFGFELADEVEPVEIENLDE
jgi:dipeptidyl aminopeptidase/acylaminoacyl peptidase